jgi:predicted transcriptional regulator
VVLGEEFESEVRALNEDLMLEPIELEILDVLNDEERRMRAKEISALINTTYQMVGKRTTKLQQMDLVHKDDAEGDMKSEITEKARSVYFDPNLESLEH